MASVALNTPDRLSAIMRMAHRLFRDETNDRPFADCLRTAWSWYKRLMASPTVRALRSGRPVHFAGAVRARPARAYVGGRQSAAYLGAMMGS